MRDYGYADSLDPRRLLKSCLKILLPCLKNSKLGYVVVSTVKYFLQCLVLNQGGFYLLAFIEANCTNVE